MEKRPGGTLMELLGRIALPPDQLQQGKQKQKVSWNKLDIIQIIVLRKTYYIYKYINQHIYKNCKKNLK